MVGLWVTLAILAIVGSLMWLLPGPAERRRMAVRQAAIARGVRVRRLFFQDLPEGEGADGEVYYLYYRLVANELASRQRQAWPPVLEEKLQGQGRGWLEWGDGYAGVVWNEQPPVEAAVEAVCQQVLSLTPRPPAPPASHSCA